MCAVYLPPPVTKVSVDEFLDNCNRVFEQSDLRRIIVGDFSLGCIDWNLVGEASYIPPSIAQNLVDFYFINYFEQKNSILNNSNRILDLVLTDINNCEVKNCSSPLSKIDPLHPPLLVSLPIKESEILHDNPHNKCLNFRKADYEAITRALDEVNWSSLFENCGNVNEMVSSFQNVIDELIKNHVPHFTKKQNKYPPTHVI